MIARTLPLPSAAARPGSRRLLFGLAISALLPFASFLVASALERELAVYMPNMIFLCGVMLAAIWFGRAIGLLTAGFAFVVYNYYLTEPRDAFGLEGLNDILTITVFVIVALVIGGLAGTLHDERNRAREQVRMLSELFAASQAMAECKDSKSALRLMVEASHKLHGNPVALFDGGSATPSLIYPQTADLPPRVAHEVRSLFGEQAVEKARVTDLPFNWRLQTIDTDGDARAILAWAQHRGARAEQASIFTELLTKLAQAAIARAQAASRELAISAMTATERLRTALLSSISHDFRTPLATIIASASSLQTYDKTFSDSTRADLLASIQEEADRLSRFVGNVLDMTRLEAGALKPRSEWTDPLELIENARDRLAKRAGDRQIIITAPAALPAIEVDPLLLEQALINVLDNAIVHTPPGSKIEIGASTAADTLQVWVEDDGDGVSPDSLEHLFDKFHQPFQEGHAGGLGLGLAISKGFVEAMKGSVCASSPAQGRRGLRIAFAFPTRPLEDRA